MTAKARLGWLGHGTVLVDLDGVRLLCDPVLRTRVAHLRRHVPVPAALLRGVDSVLLTHLHYDHLDLPSLERLGRDLPIVMPRGSARLLRRRRFTHVVETTVGETIRIGAVDVLATAAEHDGARPPFGPKNIQALGFVVQGSRRIYVAGDTGLFPEMTRIGPLDAAALPVGGWGTGLGPGHMDPAQAAEAAALLQADVAVPIHYGTYAPLGRAAPTDEPARRFAALAAERAPACRVVVLAVGESVLLDEAGVVTPAG
jgi:L-ascorbate metabolism protein UlaG (beta-lactamase superfamily)